MMHQKAAVVSFEEAVRLDPQFAAAWAALSRANSSAFFQETTAANRDAAEKALKEATRLQPDLAETQLARAYFQYWVVRDYPGALEMMQKLRASWPNNAEVLHAMLADLSPSGTMVGLARLSRPIGCVESQGAAYA